MNGENNGKSIFTRIIKLTVVVVLFAVSSAYGGTWDGDNLCRAGHVVNNSVTYTFDEGMKKRFDAAVARRDHDEVLFLLDDGVTLDKTRSNKSFVKKILNEVRLLNAAESDDLKELDSALMTGVNPDVRRPADTQWTALMIASYCGYKDVAAALIEHDASVDAYHSGALYNAVLGERLDIIKLLLENGANPNFGVGANRRGSTPLMAVKSEQAACLLLQHGADPNVIGPNEEFALGMAIDKPEVFKVLLGAGARIDIGGVSMLDYVDKIHNSEIRYIIKNHTKFENKTACRPKT